jgi:teichuronic acid biosynthesis glycosyltransferase TuaC
MRILTFTSLFPDSSRPNFGIFVYQRMVAVAKRAGNSVTVVAPVPYVPSWLPGGKAKQYRAIPKEEHWGGLQVYHPRYPFLPKIGRPFHGLLIFIGTYGLVRRLAKQGFDCIDAHFVYPDGYAAVLMGKLLKIPVVASARGTDMHLYPTFLTIRPSLRWTFRQANGLVGVCKALSDAMIELGAPRGHVRTIGNGVDCSRFFLVDPNEARQKLGLPSNPKIILAVGALRFIKGHHLLIPAMGELKKRGLPVKLYIAGEGERRPALTKQIDDLGLQDSVTLLGSVPNEQLRDWYSAANVSCLPSSREGWANVLLESMACGTPVVATRIWGTPEVIVSDEYGLLVDQSIEAIADGLQEALTRTWNREAIASYARQRSWDVVADEVERWLDECIRTHPAKAENARTSR